MELFLQLLLFQRRLPLNNFPLRSSSRQELLALLEVWTVLVVLVAEEEGAGKGTVPHII